MAPSFISQRDQIVPTTTTTTNTTTTTTNTTTINNPMDYNDDADDDDVYDIDIDSRDDDSDMNYDNDIFEENQPNNNRQFMLNDEICTYITATRESVICT